MKKLLTLFVISLLTTLSPALAQDKKNDIVVTINGMTCQMCVNSMKKIFSKEDSVNDIAVSLNNQTLTVDIKEGTNLTDAKIKELVEWGGYDLIDITRPK